MRDTVHGSSAIVAVIAVLGTSNACSGDDPDGSTSAAGAAAAFATGGNGGAPPGPALAGRGSTAASGSTSFVPPAGSGGTNDVGAGLGGKATGSSGSSGRGSVDPRAGAGGASGSSAGGNVGAVPSAGTRAAGTAGTGQPAAGPNDGDPTRPIVSIPNIPCGPQPSLGVTATNAEVGGRDIHVAYPCNKHEGAPVTFVLNLHGTMPTEDLKLYQVAYFSINTLVDSHNIITVSPKAVGSQWGNSDGGADEPHLIAVIAWVHETFAKFDIRGMWVGGHSWGAMYTATFGCKQDLADKVKGLIIMSGLATLPSCATRMALIDTVAEDDIAGPMDQKMLPAQHGCAAARELKLGNNEQTLWPDCQPGFVHSNYMMLDKAHADFMDAEVVESIADLIVESRL